MPEATYEIIRNGKTWTIDHDGTHEGDYATKEAAFEAVYAAASNAIKDGYGVKISIPQRAPGEAAVGGPAT
jgi:hypothetical protein